METGMGFDPGGAGGRLEPALSAEVSAPLQAPHSGVYSTS
jgi:hypothetical protein